MDDDEIDIQLRPPAEVAARCIVLAALVRRLSIESLAQERVDDELAGEAYDLRAWVREEGLWTSLETSEAEFLDGSLGDLSDDHMATVAWQAEGLATLGWALGLAELPHIGELTSVEAVLRLAPSPWDTIAPWLADAALRTEPEIARERDRAELTEWRVSIEAPRRVSAGRERADYEEAIADVAREAEAAGLAHVVQGDVQLASTPIASLDSDALERLDALAQERLRALNWVCGFGDSWDRVPLDV